MRRPSGPARVSVIYRGRVQGVGFRYTTARLAESHPVEGYVMNQDDGTVRLEAEGDAGDLQRFLDAIAASGLGPGIRDTENYWGAPQHRFQGFRIVALRPPEFWKGVDLRPGDIVTSVNGMSIERDTQAFEAFEQLRDAPELRVSLTREGKKRELRYRIVARGRAESPSRSRAKVRGAQRPEASATSTRTKADPTVGDPPVEGDTPVKRQPSVRRAQGVRAAPRNPPP